MAASYLMLLPSMGAGMRKTGVAILIGLLSLAASPPVLAPEAANELIAAIDILKTRHMNRDRLDWPRVEAAAFESAKDAKTAADTYPVIRDIIKQLGEKHTRLFPADNVKARQTGAKVGDAAPPYFSAPESWRLAAPVALLRIPGFQGTEADDRTYVATLRRALKRYGDAGICRFVLDLRGNWGGNMYPMLNAVKSFLGAEPYGYWVPPHGDKMAWAIPDHPLENHGAANYAEPAPDLSRAWVAVLLDFETASSGEFTAMALEGLPHTKSFGGDTAGYLTANEPMALPDGAEIAVSTSWATDRIGRSYREVIAPDDKEPGGQPTVDAALTWLKTQSCP
jgi:carboxyl-terminal processing protease